MFNLEKYIGPNETILFRFGLSLRYIVTVVLLAAAFLGAISFYFTSIGATGFFVDIPLVVLGIITLYFVVLFLNTTYFATDQKIYKKVGLGFTKVTAAKKTEIDDLIVVQSFFERVLFDTGTIKFNTPGSAGFEIILPRVAQPFETKQTLYRIWGF